VKAKKPMKVFQEIKIDELIPETNGAQEESET
jgi:hypothetical protein